MFDWWSRKWRKMQALLVDRQYIEFWPEATRIRVNQARWSIDPPESIDRLSSDRHWIFEFALEFTLSNLLSIFLSDLLSNLLSNFLICFGIRSRITYPWNSDSSLARSSENLHCLHKSAKSIGNHFLNKTTLREALDLRRSEDDRLDEGR